MPLRLRVPSTICLPFVPVERTQIILIVDRIDAATLHCQLLLPLLKLC